MVVRSRSRGLGFLDDDFQFHNFYIHVTKGAILEDRASAYLLGCAVLLVLIMMRIFVLDDIAIIGEIILRVKVLLSHLGD